MNFAASKNITLVSNVRTHRTQAERFPVNTLFHARCRRASPADGFTLIDLLITLALVLIMSVMLYGSGSRSRQQRDKAGCQKNLQRVYVALEIFANDHAGMYPQLQGAKTSEQPLSLLVPKYTVATESFVCPGGKDSALPYGEPFDGRTISYAYYMGLRSADTGMPLMSDRQIDSALRRTGDPLFSKTGDAPGNNHHKYGGNVLFVGGEIKMSRAKAEFSLSPTQAVVLLNPRRFQPVKLMLKEVLNS